MKGKSAAKGMRFSSMLNTAQKSSQPLRRQPTFPPDMASHSAHKWEVDAIEAAATTETGQIGWHDWRF
jgi:hypothetical protein